MNGVLLLAFCGFEAVFGMMCGAKQRLVPFDFPWHSRSTSVLAAQPIPNISADRRRWAGSFSAGSQVLLVDFFRRLGGVFAMVYTLEVSERDRDM